MQKTTALAAALMPLLAIGCLREDCRREPSPNNQFHFASIIEIVANPHRYHLKRVIVLGFADVDPNGGAVYLHREDYENGLFRNAIGLDKQAVQFAQINKSYASIRGCFREDDHGHLGMFVGSIVEIESATAIDRSSGGPQ